jgi:hypothetical protein
LVHIRQCYALIGKVLYRLRQFFHLRPVLLIGRGDVQGQQMPQGIDRRMHLGPFAPLGASAFARKSALKPGKSPVNRRP